MAKSHFIVSAQGLASRKETYKLRAWRTRGVSINRILSMNLKPCDILLYKGTGWRSRLIQWGTGSPYNHVAVVVDPSSYLGIESNTGHKHGVRRFDLRKLDFKEIDIFRIKAEFRYDATKVVSFLESCLGAGYDWWGVIWLGILKLFRCTAKANKFQKEHDYFCSELCYEAFYHGGLDIVPQVDSADITSPADIARSERLDKVVNDQKKLK